MEKNNLGMKEKQTFLKTYIPNPNERKRIMLTLLIGGALFLLGILYITMHYLQWQTTNMHAYKDLFKEVGSIARIGFFIVLSIFPVFYLIKLKYIKDIAFGQIKLKTILQFIGKIVRSWHVPIALISTGIVILHGYLAILKGFELNFTYFSGLISIIILFIVMFMGLKRYKKKDNKWHLKMAMCFLILFMLHATFA
ncbi:hypothetical protein [Gottfriedia acidiceleris]|uniref:hypothetical protein n=1 Tax=Gottfriedia acidiceleris TaxID=371036 RepID=UPI001F27D468|nr:hypothetical protein [Gottfriedia acidiceleris]